MSLHVAANLYSFLSLMSVSLTVADALSAEWLWLPDMGVFARVCSSIVCLLVVVCMATEAALAAVSC